MTKKICLIVTDAISFNVLYQGQLEYLNDNGFEITLICGGSHAELATLRKRNVGTVIDYKLVRPPSLGLDLLSLSKISKHLLFNRYDLVLSTTPKALLLGSIAGFLSAQPRRIAFFQGRVYENFTGFKRKAYVLLDHIVVASSHEVIFVSKSLMAEFIKDIPSTVSKAKVIGAGSSNGVSASKFAPATVDKHKIAEIRNSLNIKETDTVIVAVGRICEDKGLKEFIEVATIVAEQVANVRFIMLGNIEDDEAFERLATLRAQGIVIHVDFVTDITPYFALADLHLFLSHREGFGNVAIEAAAMGVPTIAFDVVGVRDSVAEGVSGWRFEQGDSAAVAAAILQLITNDATQETFKNAREWVIERFSQQKVWENYRDFYLNIDNKRDIKGC